MVNGIINGMPTTRTKLNIDKAGRLVLPKSLRDRLGFTPDSHLEAVEQPNGVLIKKAGERPAMVKVDGLWVHQGTSEPGAPWDSVVESVREERIQSIIKA